MKRPFKRHMEDRPGQDGYDGRHFYKVDSRRRLFVQRMCRLPMVDLNESITVHHRCLASHSAFPLPAVL